MLRDEAFSSTAKVDRYGRKLEKGKGKKDLERFYRLEERGLEKSESGQKGDEIDDEAVERELERLDGGSEDPQDSEDESEDSESTDEDDEDSDLADAESDDDDVFGLLEEEGEGREGVEKGEVSSRLAIVNLDWDKIRAIDLMAVFQSFVPANGQILNIAVYPSEFGKERMEREELEGPPKEIFARKKYNSTTEVEVDESDLEEDDDEQIKSSILKPDNGAEFSSARLRRYQISRLRYYYAVVICSSPSVASAIYDAVDGTEYLTTANYFDLRYIPDETTFDDDTPRDECSVLPDGYRPNEFVTEALQHSKVKLTWDADDGVRREAQKRAFGGSRKEVDENDLRAYLGSDSEGEVDDEADVQAPITVDATTETGIEDAIIASSSPPQKLSKKEAERQRMRALLGLSAEPAARKPKADKATPVGDMQVTFASGLSAATDDGKKRSVFENEPEREETTVEKYVRKEKERKTRRKEKMKLKNSTPGATDLANESEDSNEITAEKEAQTQQNDEEEKEDLGFNDAFFTAGTDAPSTKTTSSRKADRRRKRAEHEAAEAASDHSLTNLATQLPSTDDGANEIKHFDINALSRAEKLNPKLAKGKRKRHNLSARDKEALEAKAQDDFQMDVTDERFRDLYERAEFAVDPSHPRFRATEGMRMVLEEGRRKKGIVGVVEEGRGRDGHGDGVDGRGKRARREKGDDEVEQLVRRVKQKVGSGV